MSQHILYLHGFNSSPLSEKAELTRLYLAEHYPEVTFHCPQIANNPKAAITQLERLIVEQNLMKEFFSPAPVNSDEEEKISWHFIGSSLGGYFATYLSEKYKAPATLINPAVKPYELLTDYLGEQVNPYTQEVYQVTADYINDLQALEQNVLTKNNYLLMVQTGDEVLDYQQAVTKYQQAKIIQQQGGDHSFVDYEKMLPTIVNFFQLT